ncbi:conserved hypothetical protein [Trichinella spiralis]|uniref:hypothetical protein n=1 Tax=Trichinella spiralis TaxID=6334 RepID=UPI0001EFEBD9|nr:conserved hypothetical protein [Trichinella spiralis]
MCETFFRVSAAVFDDMLKTETGKLCAEQCQQQYAAYQQADQEYESRGYLHADPASQDLVKTIGNK